MDQATFQIRAMNSADSATVFELCLQLGYSPTLNDVCAQIELIEDRPDHFLRIATDMKQQIVAWIHGCIEIPLEAPSYVRVSALVVDVAHRGRGIGKQLMVELEQWTRQNGIRLVSLPSQMHREEAHRFYEHLGYQKMKRSFKFEKAIS